MNDAWFRVARITVARITMPIAANQHLVEYVKFHLAVDVVLGSEDQPCWYTLPSSSFLVA